MGYHDGNSERTTCSSRALPKLIVVHLLFTQDGKWSSHSHLLITKHHLADLAIICVSFAETRIYPKTLTQKLGLDLDLVNTMICLTPVEAPERRK